MSRLSIFPSERTPSNCAVRAPLDWSFVNAPQASPNFLDRLGPPNSARVGDRFTVAGIARPNSAVRITAVADGRLPFGEVDRSSVTQPAVAGPLGELAVDRDRRPDLRRRRRPHRIARP
ncbi:MAG: hypothetical protein ACLPYS_18635 [Vulcanimicrobiaceae bacterium]